jgi:hypothetical protein
MSPAFAFAAPALEIAAHWLIPGGVLPAQYASAFASLSPSPLDEALAIAPFIQACIGQSFCPFAPQSNVFGPAAALPDAAGAAEPAAGAPDAAATALAVPPAAAAAVSAAAAVGAAEGASVGAADAAAAAVAVGAAPVLVAAAVSSGVADGVPAGPSVFSAQAAQTTRVSATPIRVMILLMKSPW